MERYRAKVLILVSILLVVSYNAWFCSCKNSTTSCIKKEREAVLQLKQDLSDPNRYLSSWAREDCCLWKGVICDDLNGHVVKLQITPPQRFDIYDPYTEPYKLTVVGKLNSSLLNLRYLNHLDLSGVYLAKIPEFFGSLKELKYLNLSGTQFEGEVPKFGNLTRLEVLDNSQTYVGGVVVDVDWISHLRSLKILDMSGVNLSKAQHAMKVLSTLPSLSHLSLSSCDLSDLHLSSCHMSNSTSFTHLLYLKLSDNKIMDPSISIIFQHITSLLYLDLSYNNIKGKIATILRNSSEFIDLEELDLSHNSIKGSFPNWFVKLKYLRLDFNCFSGPILMDISELSNLLEFSLSSNQLIGTIPSSLGRLSSLTTLDLSYNQLIGPIPKSLGQLQVLESLFLNNNHLSGTIPNNFEKLSNLRDLSLSYNSLRGIISETQFSNMSRLRKLDIGYNHLTFKVESNWTPPFQLKEVHMDSCKFGTTFPKWMKTQMQVQEISFSNAFILGNLPRWLTNMSFGWLDLSYNQISGSSMAIIPPSCSFVDLSHNIISGSLPQNISRMSKWKHLYLNDNHINGTIPSSFCGVQLRQLDLANNKFHGHIPDCWNLTEDLEIDFLRLSFNHLSGFIPSSIGNLINLMSLNLNGNGLNGEIPMSLQNCRSLKILDLGENNLVGNIPAWFNHGSSSHLNIMRLRDNKFSGIMPLQLCSLSQLQILDLASNNLQGLIPSCLGIISAMAESTTQGDVSFLWYVEHVVEVIKGLYEEYTRSNLKLVAILDLSSNQLIGSIPQELTSLCRLNSLNLSHNNLSGDIPSRIGEMKSLESLDLSNNLLFGRIPQSISTLAWLSHLNLSCNNFSGPIPKGNQIQTLDDPSIYAENPFLCGDLLRKECPGKETPLAPEISPNQNHGKDQVEKLENVLFYLAMVLGFGSGFWGFIGILVFKKDWRRAYFNLLDRWIDRAYVTLALMVVRLKRRSSSN